MKILFISLGCDKNLVDSEVMLGLLASRGYEMIDDEQEADRRDAAHHDRELRVQAHEDGEHERRPEHGDDVLHAQADRAIPGEPLVRRDDLVRAERAPVTLELPTDRHVGLLPASRRLLAGPWVGEKMGVRISAQRRRPHACDRTAPLGPTTPGQGCVRAAGLP